MLQDNLKRVPWTLQWWPPNCGLIDMVIIQQAFLAIDLFFLIFVRHIRDGFTNKCVRYCKYVCIFIYIYLYLH